MSDPKTAVGACCRLGFPMESCQDRVVRCSSTAHHGAWSPEHQNSGTTTPIFSSPPSAMEGKLLTQGSWLLLSLVHHQTVFEQVGGENQWSYKSLLQRKCHFFCLCHSFDLTVILTAQNHTRIFAGSWTALPSQKSWCGFEIHALHGTSFRYLFSAIFEMSAKRHLTRNGTGHGEPEREK